MSRVQRLLTAVIAVELVELVLITRVTPLPELNLARFPEHFIADVEALQQDVSAKDAAALVQLGDGYRTYGLYPEANRCFAMAHRLAPDDTTFLDRWGMTLDKQGRLHEAIERYQRAIASGRDAEETPRIWMRLGLCYVRLGETEAAERAFRQGQQHTRAKLMLSRILYRSGRAEQAVRLLDELLAEYPNDATANFLRSWTEEELGHTDAAMDYQDRSLRGSRILHEGDHLTRQVDNSVWAQLEFQREYNVSLRLEKQGNLDQAAEAARRGVEIFGGPIPVYQLARVEIKRWRAKQAVEAIEQCHQFHGVGVGGLDLLGDALRQLGKHAEARRAWLRAVDIEDKAEIRDKLAESFRAAAQPEAARRQEGFAEFQRGKAAWLKNDLQEAKPYLLQAVEVIDDHAHAWFYLAETHRALGETEQAATAYRRCLRLNPDHGRALRGLNRLE